MINNLRIIFETYFNIPNDPIWQNNSNAIELMKIKWRMNIIENNQYLYEGKLDLTIMWNFLFDLKVFNIHPKYIQLNNKKITLEDLHKYSYISDEYLCKCQKLILVI
jgi:hypothetical protein